LIDYTPLYQALEDAGATSWVEQLPGQIQAVLNQQSHGDWNRWQSVVDKLPSVIPSSNELIDSVRIGSARDLSTELQQQLLDNLQALHPWRKGPYQVFGIDIDTEWRSDWKWDRLKNHITSLKNRLVLDVGCGQGREWF
jgi:tRNA (mo5U34)-methyltransferase